MAETGNLGYPRIGKERQLKRLLEGYWAGRIGEAELLSGAAALRRQNLRHQAEAGLDHVPVGDFALYDHVLDTALMFEAVPERFRGLEGLARLFAMARGAEGVPALEMTKWFDTNYHYMVPEWEGDVTFGLDPSALATYLAEAREADVRARPVVLGPLTFLLLGKGEGDLGLLLGRLLPRYRELLAFLAREGVAWVALDEPMLPLVRRPELLDLYREAYGALAVGERPAILLTTYFAPLRGENLATALGLPVEGLHVDLVSGGEDDRSALLEAAIPETLVLSLGVVNGRNVWRTDLEDRLAFLETLASRLGGTARMIVSPSCSLLHVPVDLEGETRLDPDLLGVLAFAREKLDEVRLLRQALDGGRSSVAASLALQAERLARWRASARRVDPEVRRRLEALTEADFRRKSPYPERRRRQPPRPLFPTTTIGSFPQTEEIRRARARRRRGEIDEAAYEEAMRQEIARVIRLQEEIGLDVLVHGEPERNDMVEYFADFLSGFATTASGWVQSYGSRTVKPPILFGDVRRLRPMTVSWLSFAQSLTQKPVKGMLTGPVTILKWSFVREDQPLETTALQIALALRDEVADLEAAGLRIVQIDEPAYREAAPLLKEEQDAYYAWASRAFRLVAGAAADETQVQSHMCYSEFNDILPWIAALDADVLLIEASRSRMELLPAFRRDGYPNEVGPGVYDIHSPRVPSAEEMAALLRRAAESVDPEKLWVNPDCGLKTRRYEEVVPALRNMVAAARRLREEWGPRSGG